MHVYTIIIIYTYLYISTFLLVLNDILLFGFTKQFIHSPTERHHGCFQIVAIMNKACEHQCAGVCVVARLQPLGEHEGWVSCSESFVRNLQTFFRMAALSFMGSCLWCCVWKVIIILRVDVGLLRCSQSPCSEALVCVDFFHVGCELRRICPDALFLSDGLHISTTLVLGLCVAWGFCLFTFLFKFSSVLFLQILCFHWRLLTGR